MSTAWVGQGWWSPVREHMPLPRPEAQKSGEGKDFFHPLMPGTFAQLQAPGSANARQPHRHVCNELSCCRWWGAAERRRCFRGAQRDLCVARPPQTGRRAPPGRGLPPGALKASGHRARHGGGVARLAGHARADLPLRSQSAARLRARQTGTVASAVALQWVGGLAGWVHIKAAALRTQRRQRYGAT
jgi:hypothetical protein